MTSPLLPAFQDSIWGVFIFGLLTFLVICALVVYFVNAWLLGAFYKKVGVEQWKAWIPVYQLWPFFELGGFSGGWALLGLATFAPGAILFTSAAIGLANHDLLGGMRFLERFDIGYLSGGIAVVGALATIVSQLAPVALTVIGAICAYRMGKVFEKDAALCVVAFVLFQPVFFGLLGLGTAQANREKLAQIRHRGSQTSG